MDQHSNKQQIGTQELKEEKKQKSNGKKKAHLSEKVWFPNKMSLKQELGLINSSFHLLFIRFLIHSPRIIWNEFDCRFFVLFEKEIWMNVMDLTSSLSRFWDIKIAYQ